MTDKDYIEKLIKLASDFRNDKIVCCNKCGECELYNIIEIGYESMTYCDILLLIERLNK